MDTMTEYGIKADYKHDYSESGKYQPRHLATFAERGNANGVIGVQDPFWVVSGPSGDATTDGFVKIGIADGTGSWPDIGAATYIKLENGKVTSRGNLDFGTFYADMAQIGAPANPAANTRRLFVDSGTGKLSVRTSAGATVSLEESGGGGGTVGGTGTAGTITKWAAGGADIEDSIITESGTAITVGGSLTVNTIVAGIADYDKFLVSHAGLVKFRSGADAYSDMGGYVTADFTTDFAAESLANLATRTHASLSDAPADAHHNKIHNLIDTTNHPVAGLTPGNFLKAITATTYGFQAHGLVASDVGAYTTAQTDSAIDTDIATHAGLPNAHHSQSHALSGADHTGDLLYTQLDAIVDIAGVGANNLISRADHVHTDADGSSKVTYSNLSGIPSTFTPIAHDLTSAYHTDSGLTTGHFLKATGTTTFAWGVHGLSASDVGAYTTAQTDSAIDTDITTHAGIATAHQDAPALISTHASDNDAHHALVTVGGAPLTLSTQQVSFNYNSNHFKLTGNNLEIGTDTPGTDEVLSWNGTSVVWITGGGGSPHALADHTDVTMTGPQLEDATMFGVANNDYEPCIPIPYANRDMNGSWVTSPTVTGTSYHYWILPKPTSKQGLKLYVRGWEIGTQDADVNNKINDVIVYGVTYNSQASINTYGSTIIAIARTPHSFAAVDCSIYNRVHVRLELSVTAVADLDMSYVNLLCYYGT